MDKTQLNNRAFDVYRQYVISNLTVADLVYYENHEFNLHDEFEDTIKEYDGDIEKFIKEWEF